MQRNDRIGSATLIVIGVMAIIVGVSFGGWYVVGNQQPSKNETAVSISHTFSQPQTVWRLKAARESHNAQAATLAESEGYLAISEWGVKIPMSEELKADTLYGIFTYNDQSDEAQTVYFASRELDTRGRGAYEHVCIPRPYPQSYGTGLSGGLIAVTRTRTKHVRAGFTTFKLGDYWYMIQPNQSGDCYRGDTHIESKAFNTLMGKALKHTEVL